MVEKWQRVPMGYFQNNTLGSLKTSFVDRIDSMEPILAHMFPEMTANLLVPVAILIYLFLLDWRMFTRKIIRHRLAVLYAPAMNTANLQN